LRATSTRSAPSEANSLAVANPIPLLPPVISALLPSSRQGDFDCLFDTAEAMRRDIETVCAA